MVKIKLDWVGPALILCREIFLFLTGRIKNRESKTYSGSQKKEKVLEDIFLHLSSYDEIQRLSDEQIRIIREIISLIIDLVISFLNHRYGKDWIDNPEAIELLQGKIDKP